MDDSVGVGTSLLAPHGASLAEQRLQPTPYSAPLRSRFRRG